MNVMTREKMSETALEVKELTVEYEGVRAVDCISFHVDKGEHLTLLGPSGCGKSSTLRGIAGLEKPRQGEIVLFGTEIFSVNNGINIPAEQRGMSMVFQSYAIWPHMTVFENVAYPLKLRKEPNRQIKEKVQDTLKLVGMSGFEDRPASNLRGGQQQRIALARAMVFDPKIILLDEPLSNLDAKLRAKMRVELKLLQRNLKVTSIYVTHDQEESLLLSDRIILLNQGKIEQIGTPQEIYRNPRTRFAAEFIPSANVFTGAIGQAVDNDLPVLKVSSDGTIFFQDNGSTSRHTDNAAVYINASFFSIDKFTPSQRINTWEGTITSSFFVGDYIEYFVETAIGNIRVRSLPKYIYQEGETVSVHVDPENCHLIPG